ncbi:hypothetical protein THRCLA_20192 [Thraustotheca clavata]|uniref:Uncharacterized protein n=1 Tax=Thraustotheca clavata TaxID=74557 RepID=A0A1W0AAB4_9STRA|nr:hypothetical protein THRCLA_20192 [Thraustotheca clavata]
MLYFLFDPSGPFCSSTKAYRSWFFLCPWVGVGFGLLVFAIQPKSSVKEGMHPSTEVQTTTQESIEEPKNEESNEQVPSFIAPLSSFDDVIENLLDCRSCGSPLPTIQEKRRVRCPSCKASWCRACHSKFHLLPTCMRLRRRTSSDVALDY